MRQAVIRLLGDTPFRVLIKLLVLSFVAGLVMSTIGVSVADIYQGILNFFRRIWDLGFGAIANSMEYLLLGAAIVVPVFIILRLLNLRSPR